MDDLEFLLEHDSLNPDSALFELRFLHYVEDRRLKRLVKRVWRRLPFSDQVVLSDLLQDLSDDHTGEPQRVLGSVGPTELHLPSGGPAAEVVKDASSRVSLRGARHIKSEAACMFVIAHEFAHVVLRHQQMGLVVGSLLGFEPPIYTRAQLETLRHWHEEEANLQVWVWGFQDEFLAFLEEFPGAPRPGWHLELEVGTGNAKGTTLITKGDNRDRDNPPVTPGQVLGKVEA